MKLNTLSGSKAHLWQRLSALYLLFYLPLLAWQSLTMPYQENLQVLFGTLIQPQYLVPSLIAIFFTGIHTWIGLRDILIDYTPNNRTLYWLWGLRWLLILASLDIAWILFRMLTTSIH
ncbi:succinate dehydrogenase, hydrophobic membrane anchor protein [Thiomicrorhabdus sp. ZW0627]|uniref:succinate dehydrogenase, hydrophobic membrane anchor protein n=1 Tax=Thiomicrorhabdus sp. ZW0627 TaxID=3039774 RepID=UPI0024364262|nr:succinate dehydrogenase, hydrophobic membrane anchor protein [Thiomicrorhabdus sp. ZW0627]MDG6773102.1 succinate dehydrogenase, hydrophobic membrane anchor protein [Thiomicrorhabdus sp. ZW0627]